ncbi:hypothetical protein FQN50_005427 [Emmonsiellopsis sp. PD_5]|nr:hypothetical protein FQN50_005427 [Emmonsiellopsis sp. PD_5]
MVDRDVEAVVRIPLPKQPHDYISTGIQKFPMRPSAFFSDLNFRNLKSSPSLYQSDIRQLESLHERRTAQLIMSSPALLFRRSRLANPFKSAFARSPRTQYKESFTQRRCLAVGRPIPKVMEVSVWTSIVPKFLRNREWLGAPRKREPNPATFYVIIFLLIGSQAIRMIGLRNDFANYCRSADAKIRLLKEVIERVQKGEDVDVKRLLGTGDEAKEREWEEVLKEIEQEESRWHSRKSGKGKGATDESSKPANKSEPSSQPESGKAKDAPKSSSDGTAAAAKSTPRSNFF